MGVIARGDQDQVRLEGTGRRHELHTEDPLELLVPRALGQMEVLDQPLAFPLTLGTLGD